MDSQKYRFNFVLDRDKIEDKYGIQIPLKEWIPFCKAFEEYYLLEFDGTMEWLISEGWEEVREEYI